MPCVSAIYKRASVGNAFLDHQYPQLRPNALLPYIAWSALGAADSLHSGPLCMPTVCYTEQREPHMSSI